MKANELRIGNLLHYKEEVVTVSGMYQGGCFVLGDKGSILLSIDNLKPIQLTEEWLEKFGFKSNPYNDTYYIENIYFEGCKLVFECNKTRGFTELWSDKFPLVENVHQLQNLYFSLCGEEL